MDGYVVPRTIYKLRFVGDDYDGIVVRARKMSLGTALESQQLTAWTGDEKLSHEDRLRHLGDLHRTFLGHVVDWNLTEEDGASVPCTFEGLRSLEGEFVSVLVAAWLNTPVSVAAPLEQPSSDGETSLEASMETVTLSPSLAS